MNYEQLCMNIFIEDFFIYSRCLEYITYQTSCFIVNSSFLMRVIKLYTSQLIL
jgi:hypothetical protein